MAGCCKVAAALRDAGCRSRSDRPTARSDSGNAIWHFSISSSDSPQKAAPAAVWLPAALARQGAQGSRPPTDRNTSIAPKGLFRQKTVWPRSHPGDREKHKAADNHGTSSPCGRGTSPEQPWLRQPLFRLSALGGTTNQIALKFLRVADATPMDFLRLRSAPPADLPNSGRTTAYSETARIRAQGSRSRLLGDGHPCETRAPGDDRPIAPDVQVVRPTCVVLTPVADCRAVSLGAATLGT